MEFGYLPVSPRLALDGESARLTIDEYASGLRDLGGERWSEDRLDDSTPLFYFLISGGTENEVLRLRNRRSESIQDEPIYLLAHPRANSLPAALEVFARFRADGIRGRIFYLPDPGLLESTGSNGAVGQQITDAVHDLAVRRALRRTRIGCLGKPSNWLVASRPQPGVVTEVWGPEVVPIPMDRVKHVILSVRPEAARSEADAWLEEAQGTARRTPADVVLAARVYLALKQIAAAATLDALTVRCFDLVQDLQTTSCLALSQLNDDGIVAGCEGDLVSSLTLLWAAGLLGEIGWMANPAQVDLARNTLLLAHCSAPRGMLRAYRLRSHYESGLGVAIQGTFPSGPITLLRLGGPGLDRLWLAEGSIVGAPNREDLCRTQAEVQLADRSDLESLLRAPLGNHLAMVAGHHRARVQSWWDLEGPCKP